MPSVRPFSTVFYLNIANYNGFDSGADHWEPIHDARFSGSTRHSEAVELRRKCLAEFAKHGWKANHLRTVKVIAGIDR